MKERWQRRCERVEPSHEDRIMVTLSAGRLELTLAPERGGAIASFTSAGRPLFHPVADPNLIAQPGPLAAYPLVPFSNRIGYGRFTWDGAAYQLAPNFDDEPHTIHGNGWMRRWHVDAASAREAKVSLEHNPPADPMAQWPFRYAADQMYRLDETSVEITIGITNRDTRVMPAGIGLHPYVTREAGTTLQFGATAVWQSGDDGLPERRLSVEGGWDYRTTRQIVGPKIDNCYEGWNGSVLIGWPNRGETLTITAPTTLRHLVLFTPEGRDYFGIEPVSNMSNGVNHLEIAENGIVALAPGGRLEAKIRFQVGVL